MSRWGERGALCLRATSGRPPLHVTREPEVVKDYAALLREERWTSLLFSRDVKNSARRQRSGSPAEGAKRRESGGKRRLLRGLGNATGDHSLPKRGEAQSDSRCKSPSLARNRSTENDRVRKGHAAYRAHRPIAGSGRWGPPQRLGAAICLRAGPGIAADRGKHRATGCVAQHCEPPINADPMGEDPPAP
jgi:hypothetical protein